MKLYLILLKALLIGDNYRLYRNGVNTEFVDSNYSEVGKLYRTLDNLQERESKDYTLDDLKLRFYTLYPKITPKSYDELFQQLAETQFDQHTVQEYLHSTSQRAVAFKLATEALHVADGRKDVDSLLRVVTEAPELLKRRVVKQGDSDPYAHERPNQNIKEFLEQRKTMPGLRWRLNSLNKSVGSLRKGNFGFIFARPEIGKSAFILSESTNMATQLNEGEVGIWFDNEEEGQDIHERILSATIGWTQQEIRANPEGAQEIYDRLGGRKLYMHSEGSMTKNFIEERLEYYKPKFIFINQLDKVRGFAADRYDLEMKAVYQWARELAKIYGPVVGVCQAGGTADGKQFLTMNDVDSSHTAKQGEADWILGIGYTNESGMQYLRYFNLLKNKLPGDADSDPQMRHARWTGLIVPEISRFKDID